MIPTLLVLPTTCRLEAATNAVTTSYQPSRFRPAVVQSAIDPPPSPLGYSSQTIDRDYHITPAVSAPSRREHREHKKLYSVDDGKAARLVADIDTTNTSRRRDSTERGGYRSSGLGGNRKGYHLNGPLVRAADKKDDYGFSYTDAAGMYRDTEPRWRARRGSAEATGRRDRLSGALESFPPRSSDRALGPPPAVRGLEKVNEGFAIPRSASVRDPVRSLSRDKPGDYGLYRETDPYAMPTRTSSVRQPAAVHQERDPRYDAYSVDYDDRRDARESRRPTHAYDANVESRGFGIRAPSTDRYAPHEESLDRGPSYAGEPLVQEPDVRNYVRDPLEDSRREQDRRDREWKKERERQERDKELRRAEMDRERELEKGRDRDWDRERDRPREHDRERERRDRDRERDDRSPRDSGDRIPGIVPAAVAATGALAAGEAIKRHKRDERYDDDELQDRSRKDRERDRGGDRDREKGREYDRRDRDRNDRIPRDSGGYVPPVAGAATVAAGEYGTDNPTKRSKQEPRDEPYNDSEDRSRGHRKAVPSDESITQERECRYVVPDEDAHELRERGKGPEPTLDPDEEYRRRVQQMQQEMQRANIGSQQTREPQVSDSDREKARQRMERKERQDTDRAAERAQDVGIDTRPIPRELRRVPEDDLNSDHRDSGGYRERHNDQFDAPLENESAEIFDSRDRNERRERENRVRIVEPPSDKDAPPPVKGILRKPKEKFPEDPNPVREGVAPLKDATKKGIPPGARWTKIDRRLVNPQALEEAKERFEERQDCVIVLRVLTKEEIQKLADRTLEIRGNYPLFHPEPESITTARRPKHNRTSKSRSGRKSSATPKAKSKRNEEKRNKLKLSSFFTYILDSLLTRCVANADERYEEERRERKHRKREDRDRDRGYGSDEDRPLRAIEAPPSSLDGVDERFDGPGAGRGADSGGYARNAAGRSDWDKERDRGDDQYMSGGLGR
ncbi:hypothetical protein B0A49_06154 [Cryomyces minteri]|uniref:DUF8035 domain-containing protein n=1 Tax=Cryomyces minteri TaxID=331657 RepID=A0A4V5NG93_9PEZI|nr:hypothetical protein B0A49_06154 [Cryomyces minteri]